MAIADLYETMEYGLAPESPAQALAWIRENGPRFGLFLAGAWRPPAGEHYFDSVNPATGATLAQIAQAGPEDLDAAVSAACGAQPEWAGVGGHVRARYLYAMARQIQKHARLFAVLETLDNGKPIRETRDIDIPLVARHFYHHAGWAQLMAEEFAGYAPVGVVGQIIPWNFPLLMLAWKIAPALAMGCTVVLKPAEFTSLTALAFADVCRQIELPPGVVNIVTGDGAVGEMITKHPDIRKIAFTGSTEVGRIIRRVTAGSGKKLSLELGGKSPFVVFEDADLDSVVEGVVDAIWFNQGEVCCAGSRLLVQEGAADRLIQKLRARMDRLRVGDPLDKATDIGAVVAPVQLEKIRRLVEIGIAEGAEIWQPARSYPQEGCFFPPTLFTNVAPAATIAQVEIFGPVLVTMTFRTPSEAIALANNTRYGLAASVWTENISLALDVAPKIRAGTIWINSTNLFDAASGFGGYRESGYGREGGREGLWEYLQPAAPPAAPPPKPVRKRAVASARAAAPLIDRTPKLYIGGKQVRPDSGYSLRVTDALGEPLGEVGAGNRKDIRNAVEAAHAAWRGWAGGTAHNRAQILYYLAENLAARAPELAARIGSMTADDPVDGAREVELSIERLYTWAAWADKYDGLAHHTAARNITLAMPEPIGVLGILCPDPFPLLAFVSTVMPAIAMGNTVVVVPSERCPLAATDFYQVLETSDVPGGVVNIVTGPRDALAETLAGHDDVEAVWYFGPADGSAQVEYLSATNMKRTWVSYGKDRDWAHPGAGQGQEFLRAATHIKNIWIPYSDGIPGLD